MPFISIIIPNYNHATYLRERIESVLHQTYQDFELILLDDCSTDNSKAIIELYTSHPMVSAIIYNDTNSGSTFSQWNKGIEIARGEIIWLAESDDIADKDFLKSLVPYFEEDQGVGIAYCQSYRYNGNNEITGNWKSWTDDLDKAAFNNWFKMDGVDYINRFLLYKNTIPNASAVLFRKKIFQQIGGADATVINCSDWLTWLKMLTVSKIIYTPLLLNYFRYHENSVIASSINNSSDIYLNRFERILREKLNYFFRVNSTIRNNCKTVYYGNRLLLKIQYQQEGFFELDKKNFRKGWLKILQSAFAKGVNGKVIISTIKKMRKTFNSPVQHS